MLRQTNRCCGGRIDFAAIAGLQSGRLGLRIPVDGSASVAASPAAPAPTTTTSALFIIAVEGYRTGALTEGQVRRLVGLETRFEVHALLKEHKILLEGFFDENGE